jgi:hypothetical protein
MKKTRLALIFFFFNYGNSSSKKDAVSSKRLPIGKKSGIEAE